MGRICLCDSNAWWIVMMSLTCTCITFEITSLALPRWFSQGHGSYRWTGGLLTPYPSSTYYRDKTCDRDFHKDGFCDMFDNLWIGGNVYIIFEGFSLVMFFCCVVLFIVELAKKKNLVLCITIVMWIAIFSHFIGFVTWAALGKMTYEGSCEEFYTEGGDKPADICREEGATMALFIILYCPIVGMMQTALWYHDRENRKENSKKEIKYSKPEDNPEISSREFSHEIQSESIEASK